MEDTAAIAMSQLLPYEIPNGAVSVASARGDRPGHAGDPGRYYPAASRPDTREQT